MISSYPSSTPLINDRLAILALAPSLSRIPKRSFESLSWQCFSPTCVRLCLKAGQVALRKIPKTSLQETPLLEEYPNVIMNTQAVPHDWLFPKVRAVVHHGGAGTTAAGLRAGRPTVVKSFFADQFFWGERVEEMGEIGMETAIQYIYRDMTLARDRTLSSAQKSRAAAEEELQETQALGD
ncbi:hypothetical protein [Absidia glauca]|uniref:Erythromycin biosynthesis protein CIII-like C-terminal domain-containing protein n=1 Tax=Absidia glauca TaxID=4829 RepID=A0A168KRT2_ABSGL|nr:hypothetical protein [Absidia glauca]